MSPRILACFLLFLFARPAQAQFEPVLQHGHFTGVRHGVFSPFGRWLFTWSEDGRLLRWDLVTLQHFEPVTGFESTPRWLVFTDEQHYLTQCFNNVIYQGHVDSGHVVPFDTLPNNYALATFQQEGSKDLIVLGERLGDAKLGFYYPDVRQLYHFKKDPGISTLNAMAPAPNNNGVFLADDKKQIWFYNTIDGGIHKLLEGDSLETEGMAVCGRYLVCRVENGKGETRILAYELSSSRRQLTGKVVRFNSAFRPSQLVADPSGLSVWMTGKSRTEGWRIIEWNPATDRSRITATAVSDSRFVPSTSGIILGVLHASGNTHALFNTRLGIYSHRLGLQTQSMGDVVYNESTGDLHMYSGTTKTLQHLHLSGLEMDRTSTPLGNKNLAYVRSDGSMIQAAENMKQIYIYRADGRQDSMPNPITWLPAAFNRRYGHLAGRGKGVKQTLICDMESAAVIQDKLPNTENWIADIFYAPDGHFLAIEVKRRVFQLYSAPKYDLKGKRQIDMNKLVGKEESVSNRYLFTDSGRHVLFVATGFKNDAGFSRVYTVYAARWDGRKYRIAHSWQFGRNIQSFFPGDTVGTAVVLFEQVGEPSKMVLLGLENGFESPVVTLEAQQVKSVQYLKNGLLMVRGNGGSFRDSEFGSVSFHDPETGERKYALATDPSGFVLLAKDGTMLSTKGASSLIAYRLNVVNNERLLPGRLLEAKFNKPHEVLKGMGSEDSGRVKLYEAAWKKRLARSAMKMDFNPDSIPEVWMSGLNNRGLTAANSVLTLPLQFRCRRAPAERIYVSINGIPYPSPIGIPMTDTGMRGQKPIYLRLNPGTNRIEMRLRDRAGFESLPLYFEVWCTDSGRSPLTYFIGLGVSHYADSSMNLVYAAKDTRDLSAFISTLPGARLDTFTDARVTRECLQGIKSRLLALQPQDRVIVAFSGHGLLDSALQFYLAPHAMDFDHPRLRGITLETLLSILDSTPAKQKLLFIDACHSGELDRDSSLRFTPGTVPAEGRGGRMVANALPEKGPDPFEFMKASFEDLASGNGTVIISAAGGKEFALENDRYSNGVFTWCLLRGWRDGAADDNGDHEISVEELKNYLIKEVPLHTGNRQRPTARRENPVNPWFLPR